MHIYQNLPVEVISTQWNQDGDHKLVFFHTELRTFVLEHDSKLIKVSKGDWVVEFPNSNFHILSDNEFKSRFKQISKNEIKNEYILRLAEMGDCC